MASSEIGDLAEKLVRELEEMVRAAEERGARIVREAEAEAERILAAARDRAADSTAPRGEPNGEADAPEVEKLTAMRLAVQGGTNASIAAELEAQFGPGDRSALIDDVLRRAAEG